MVKSFYDPKVEQRGIEKGMEKGIEKGIIETKFQIAAEMIRDGESIEKIKKYTKLDENKILELLKQLGSDKSQ